MGARGRQEPVPSCLGTALACAGRAGLTRTPRTPSGRCPLGPPRQQTAVASLADWPSSRWPLVKPINTSGATDITKLTMVMFAFAAYRRMEVRMDGWMDGHADDG